MPWEGVFCRHSGLSGSGFLENKVHKTSNFISWACSEMDQVGKKCLRMGFQEVLWKLYRYTIQQRIVAAFVDGAESLK